MSLMRFTGNNYFVVSTTTDYRPKPISAATDSLGVVEDKSPFSGKHLNMIINIYWFW